MPATPAAAGQPGCRLAILSSSLGKRSETFIHRHMLDLAPGETVVVAGRREPGLAPELEAIPHLELGEARRDLRWLWQSGLYLLRATRETPTQRRARAFLEMHRPGVLLGEYMNQSLRWLPLAERMRLPFFVHAHGYDVSASLRDPATCRRYLQYERARGIIVFADVCRRRLVGLGLSGANIHVIPYGVDVPGAPPGHAARETVRCLAVGRMTAKKAPLLTLEAFARALAAYPHMRLDFVGTGELSEEAALWQDPEYIKIQAKQRFYMVLPGEVPLVVLTDPEGAARDAGVPPAETSSAPPNPWYDTLWSSLQAANEGLPE